MDWVKVAMELASSALGVYQRHIDDPKRRLKAILELKEALLNQAEGILNAEDAQKIHDFESLFLAAMRRL